MQSANDVKIYNLSAGKSIPEWISDRKRRRLERKHIGYKKFAFLSDTKILPFLKHPLLDYVYPWPVAGEKINPSTIRGFVSMLNCYWHVLFGT